VKATPTKEAEIQTDTKVLKYIASLEVALNAICEANDLLYKEI
jgi:hypothetical protein